MLSYITGGSGKPDDEGQEAMVKEFKDMLTEKELEQTAYTDHIYYQMMMAKRAGVDWKTEEEIQSHREWVIDEMVRRYLRDKKWNLKKAHTNMSEMLLFREHQVGNYTRYCFYDKGSTGLQQQIECQKLMRRFVGKKPFVLHMDYDKEGRANILFVGRFCLPERKDDVQGWVGCAAYVFERALAAMIRRGGPNKSYKCNVILDFDRFDRHKHAMPMFMAHEMMRAVFQCHPKRVYCGYGIDLNTFCMFVARMLKPLVYGVGCDTGCVLSGKDSRIKKLGEHYLPENIDKIDIEEYYARPFDYAYHEELPTDEEVLKPSYNGFDQDPEVERDEIKTWPLDMPKEWKDAYRMGSKPN